MNVQVFVLLPPLEHAPDQIASRLLVTLSVMDVPTGKLAEAELPTGTLSPAGLDVTRSPLRPVADTVSVAVPDGADGFTVSEALRVTPPKTPLSVTADGAVTLFVVTAKVALVAPAAIVTLAGTVATAGLLLDKKS